eukprot:g10552.t1
MTTRTTTLRLLVVQLLLPRLWLLLTLQPLFAYASGPVAPPVDHAAFTVEGLLGSGQGSDVYRVNQRQPVPAPPFENAAGQQRSPPPVQQAGEHEQAQGQVASTTEGAAATTAQDGSPSTSRPPQSLALKFFEPRRWLEADIAQGKLDGVEKSTVRQFFRWGRAGMRHFLTGLELLPDSAVDYMQQQQGQRVDVVDHHDDHENLLPRHDTHTAEAGREDEQDLYHAEQKEMTSLNQQTSSGAVVPQKLIIDGVEQRRHDGNANMEPHVEGMDMVDNHQRLLQQLPGPESSSPATASSSSSEYQAQGGPEQITTRKGATKTGVVSVQVPTVSAAAAERDRERRDEFRFPEVDEVGALSQESEGPPAKSSVLPLVNEYVGDAFIKTPKSAIPLFNTDLDSNAGGFMAPRAAISDVVGGSATSSCELAVPEKEGDEVPRMCKEIPRSSLFEIPRSSLFSPPAEKSTGWRLQSNGTSVVASRDGAPGGGDASGQVPQTRVVGGAAAATARTSEDRASVHRTVPQAQFGGFFGSSPNNYFYAGRAPQQGSNAEDGAPTQQQYRELSVLRDFALRLLRDERGETETSKETRAQFGRIRSHIVRNYLPSLKRECGLMHRAHETWEQRVKAGYLPRGQFELKNPFPNCHIDKSALDFIAYRSEDKQSGQQLVGRPVQVVHRSSAAGPLAAGAGGGGEAGELQMSPGFRNPFAAPAPMIVPSGTSDDSEDLEEEWAGTKTEPEDEPPPDDAYIFKQLMQSGAEMSTPQQVVELLQNKLRRGFYMVLDYVDDAVPLDAIPQLLRTELFPELYETYVLGAFSYFHPYPEVKVLEKIKDAIEAQVSAYLYSRVFARVQNGLAFLHSEMQMVHNDVQGGNVLVRKKTFLDGARLLYERVAAVVTLEVRTANPEGLLHVASAGLGGGLGSPDGAAGDDDSLTAEQQEIQAAQAAEQQQDAYMKSIFPSLTDAWAPDGKLHPLQDMGAGTAGAVVLDDNKLLQQKDLERARRSLNAQFPSLQERCFSSHCYSAQLSHANTALVQFLEVTIVDFGLTVSQNEPALSFAMGFALPLKHFCLLRRGCRHLSQPIDDMFALGVTFLALVHGPVVLSWSQERLDQSRTATLRQFWAEAADRLDVGGLAAPKSGKKGANSDNSIVVLKSSPAGFLLKKQIWKNLFLARVQTGDAVYDELSGVALRFANTVTQFRHPPMHENLGGSSSASSLTATASLNFAESWFKSTQRTWLLVLEIGRLLWVQFWIMWGHVPVLAAILLVGFVSVLLAVYALLLLCGWFVLSGRLLRKLEGGYGDDFLHDLEGVTSSGEEDADVGLDVEDAVEGEGLTELAELQLEFWSRVGEQLSKFASTTFTKHEHTSQLIELLCGVRHWGRATSHASSTADSALAGSDSAAVVVSRGLYNCLSKLHIRSAMELAERRPDIFEWFLPAGGAGEEGEDRDSRMGNRFANTVFLLQALGRLCLRPGGEFLSALLDKIYASGIALRYPSLVAYELFRLDLWHEALFEQILLAQPDAFRSTRRPVFGLKSASNLLLAMAYFSINSGPFAGQLFRDAQRVLAVPDSHIFGKDGSLVLLNSGGPSSILDAHTSRNNTGAAAALSKMKILEIALRTKFWQQQVPPLVYGWLKKVRFSGLAAPEFAYTNSEFQRDVKKHLDQVCCGTGRRNEHNTTDPSSPSSAATYFDSDYETDVTIGPWQIDFVVKSPAPLVTRHIALETQGQTHYYRLLAEDHANKPL